MLIAGIHVGSIHYAKSKTIRANATRGVKFQCHFEGHKSPSGSILKVLSYETGILYNKKLNFKIKREQTEI